MSTVSTLFFSYSVFILCANLKILPGSLVCASWTWRRAECSAGRKCSACTVCHRCKSLFLTLIRLQKSNLLRRILFKSCKEYLLAPPGNDLNLVVLASPLVMMVTLAGYRDGVTLITCPHTQPLLTYDYLIFNYSLERALLKFAPRSSLE